MDSLEVLQKALTVIYNSSTRIEQLSGEAGEIQEEAVRIKKYAEALLKASGIEVPVNKPYKAPNFTISKGKKR